MDNRFGCGRSRHMVRYFLNVRVQGKGSGQDQERFLNETPKKNRFYALRSRGEQETFLDVVTCMLRVFYVDVYALFDSGATLFFVTSLVAKMFDIFREIMHQPFILSTRVDEPVIAKR